MLEDKNQNLKLFNILEGTFNNWMECLKSFVLIGLVVQVPLLISMGLYLVTESFQSGNQDFQSSGSSFLIMLLSGSVIIMNFLAMILQPMALYKVVTSVSQGHAVRWKEVMWSLRSKLWSYLGAVVLMGLAGMCGVLVIQGITYLVMLVWDNSGLYPYRNYLLGTIYTLIGLPVVYYLVRFYIDYCMTFSAMFMDDTRCDESMKRSCMAAKGNRLRILRYFICLAIPLILALLVIFLVVFSFSSNMPTKGCLTSIFDCAFSVLQVLVEGFIVSFVTMLYMQLKKQPNNISSEIVP